MKQELSPEMQERIAMYGRARAAIFEKEEGKELPSRGKIECPKCGHTLNYTIASNGHAWGRCETPDCLAWME